jgi:transmembrane sensor
MMPENNRNLAALLGKYADGSISAAEKHELFEFIAYKENESVIKQYFLSQLNDFKTESSEPEVFDREKVFSRIFSELKLEKAPAENNMDLKNRSVRIRRTLVRAVGVAAALTGAFFLGSYYSTRNTGTAEAPVREITYTEIRAPFGSNSEVYLPDGSQVRLNAGSSIRYSTDFNEGNRDLLLTGEAYFKVAKNTDLPLIVKAGMIYVKATGTEFNVKAYDDEETIETTLVEGKVEITRTEERKSDEVKVNLNPNQKAIFIKNSGSFSLNDIEKEDQAEPEPERTLYDDILISPKVDVDQVSAWTKGRLVIRGEKLESLCQKLQRKYDVSFVYMDEEIKSFRFNGILLDETLEQVLNAIKLSAPIYYNLTGKTVYLNLDRAQLNDYSKHLK